MASALVNFDLQKTYVQTIEVEDIGNCAIRSTNAGFEDYYIVIQTVMGKTSILTFGPILADVSIIQEDFNLNFKKIDYKEKNINNEINKFINDTRKAIKQAEVISIEEALQTIPTYEAFIPVD